MRLILHNHLIKTWTNAESNLIKIKEYVKNNYDKAIRSLSLEPGDWVWIKNQGGDRLADLTMPWLGPYPVKEINGLNALINIKNKDYQIHLNRLKYANMNSVLASSLDT